LLTARNLGGYAPGGGATAGAAIDGTSATDFIGGTSGNDLIRGLDGNDGIYGGAGNDRLEGGAGDDALDGELGDDELHGGDGNDTINDVLTGSDQLYGEDGNDSLFVDRQWFGTTSTSVLMDGGAGADQLHYLGRLNFDDVVMNGGGGNDFISIYLARNVTIDAGEGDDFVGFDIGIKNLTITLGAGSDQLEPSTNDAAVVGFTVLDFQPGDAGDHFYFLPLFSRLIAGWDYSFNPFATNQMRLAQSGSDALVQFNSDGIGHDWQTLARLANVDAASLTQFNMSYAPGTIAYLGTAGADDLRGTPGAELLVGLGGNDTYFIDNAGDRIEEAAGEGSDNVASSISYALNAGAAVEFLSTTSHGGTAAINLTGNELGQVVIGNAGSNWLDGGGGVDVLQGLGGNDFLFVESDDFVLEAAGGGIDNVLARTSFALNAGQEIEFLSTTNHGGTANINLTGNEFGQVVIGNAGSNWLDGGSGGVDGLQGLGGNDFLFVDANDFVIEAVGGGTDNVLARTNFALNAGQEIEFLSTTSHGGTADINLVGNEFGQIVIGNAGSNILDGGLGADYLQGLGGNDVFAFTTGLGGGNVDNILDFSAGDRIGLDDGLFVGIGGPGAMNANAFFAGTSAHDADDRIIYDATTGNLYFDADGNGAGAQVLFATLSNHAALNPSDFVVI
jgi:Ca2+-binding RTX toxin-like protein